jgi:hypothetical protein
VALYTPAYVRVTALAVVPQANVSPLNYSFIKVSGSSVGSLAMDDATSDPTPLRFASSGGGITPASPATPMGVVTTFAIPVPSRVAGDHIQLDGYDNIGSTFLLEVLDEFMVVLASVSPGASGSDYNVTLPLMPVVLSDFWTNLTGSREVV